jgi:hypothetical protein
MKGKNCLWVPGLMFALILFDQMMTPEEQQKTGISTLTMQQKAALSQWIDDHFVAKQQKKLYLAFNRNNGKTLQLSDGSVYDVAPEDQDTTALWITPFPIRLEPSGDPNYPIKLVNANTGEGVRAKRTSP